MILFSINDGLNHTNVTMSQQQILHLHQDMSNTKYFFLCMADNSLMNQNHKPWLTHCYKLKQFIIYIHAHIKA